MNFSHNNNTIPFAKITYCFFLILFFIILISTQNVSAGSINGRYLNISQGTVKLRINVSSPAPQSIILEQYLPAGTTVLSTSPKARKIHKQSGKVVWLFKRVSPGNINITMNVSPGSAANSVSGTLRYRLPGGEFVEAGISR